MLPTSTCLPKLAWEIGSELMALDLQWSAAKYINCICKTRVDTPHKGLICEPIHLRIERQKGPTLQRFSVQTLAPIKRRSLSNITGLCMCTACRAIYSVARCTQALSQVSARAKYMYRGNPVHSTLNIITGLGMCKVCTQAVQ